MSDGPVHPAIARLARIGSSGSSTDHNHQTNLVALLATCGFMEMIFKIGGDCSIHDVVPPSVIFRNMHRRSRHRFVKHLGADSSSLQSFWTGLFASPAGRELRARHNFLRHKSPWDLRHTIPLALHEDAGPYAKKKSCNVITFFSLVGQGTELETHFLVMTELKKAGVPADKGDAAWQNFFKELELLEAGHDADGDSLAQDADGTIWT